MKNTSSNTNTYSTFFGNLANPFKAAIISCLKESEKGMSVQEIAEKMNVEQSKLSHALAGLRECNLVNVSKEGKSRVYSLNRKTLLPILEIIDEHAKSNCAGKCWACVGCSQ